ncbi:MAG: class I SAM-dependent methyltransferase, partial [Candidatus Paceibacterales bacterium]
MSDIRTTSYEYDRFADRKRLDFISDTLKRFFPAAGHVLDVGCGNGVISRHLGNLGYDVVGIDVSEKTIENASARTSIPNVRFMKMSAEELVSSGQKYDVVICSEVLEHLTDPNALLAVLYSSLADNGKLIVTVPNGRGPRELLVTRPLLHLRNRENWLWKLILKLKGSLGYKGTTAQSAADNLDHIQFFSFK